MSEQENGRADISRRTVLTGLTALTAATSLGFAPRRAHAIGEPTVETTTGKVRGQRGAAGGYKFLCVPYGASTAGAARFMPPEFAKPWAGVREAPKQPIIAPQINPNAKPPAPGSPRAAISGIGSEAGSVESEDCLNVTIYTPAIGLGRLPVMFWCHGGGFFSGSGSNPMYDGSQLATRGNVVVVNVTHRLGVLGYAHLAAAGDDFATSGNVGMMDLALALSWVRDNIDRFGGDPKRVLIFGQSGGGAKVSILTAMPSAKGLFHRAAIQSGAQRAVRAPDDAATVSAIFMNQLGLKPNQAKELQQVPLDKLMAANFALAAQTPPPGKQLNFVPVLDGQVVPRHPFEPIANSLNADIPLIVGGVRTEPTPFMLSDETAFKLDADGLQARAHALLGEKTGAAAVALYKDLQPQASPSDLYFQMLSDRNRRQSILLAELKAAQGVGRAYLYQLMWNTPVFDGMLRSPHSIDLPMVFDIAGGARWSPYTGGGEGAQKLAHTMSDSWVAFAYTGDPGNRLMPWPSYTLAKRDTMLFNETSAASPDPSRATRMFWDDVANGAV